MRVLMIFVLCFLSIASTANADETKKQKPQVILQTSKGDITIELEIGKAPVTVKNFIGYVNSGFYNMTIFHRVIPGFMIQGGGFDPEMDKKPNIKPIINEADNGLKNDRGTIAMARTSDPHSATSQFFINTVDNKFLNHKGKDSRGWGYAVFGRVIKGMDVLDAISRVKTGNRGHYKNVPIEPVIIKKAEKANLKSD